MTTCKLYHNPKCSKSRAALQWLQEKKAEITVIEYLKTPPSADELKKICHMLDKHPSEITRYNNDTAKRLDLKNQKNMPAEKWFTLLHQHPELIERPICVLASRAAIGRPLEDIIALFD